MQTYDRIEAAFPSEGGAEMVVIKADDATSAKVVSGIEQLKSETAARPALFEGKPSVELSSDKTVASVTIPTVGKGTDDLSNRGRRRTARRHRPEHRRQHRRCRGVHIG